MTPVTLYLRTSLFTLKSGHIPMGALIIKGQTNLDEKGSLTVHTESFLDERGKLIEDRAVKVLIPWSKIDHVHLDD